MQLRSLILGGLAVLGSTTALAAKDPPAVNVAVSQIAALLGVAQ
jgi:hypothetical protein